MLGFGAKGGEGRCFRFWNEFVTCVQAQGVESADCFKARQDYKECLHHRKEYTHMSKVMQEFKKQSKDGTLDPEVQRLLTTDLKYQQ